MREQRTSVMRQRAARPILPALDRARSYPSVAAFFGAALVGCHGGDHATQTRTANVAPTPVTPPPRVAQPVVPTPTPPPPGTTDPTAQAQLHEGDPCPLHDHGTVLTEATARTLPAAHRAHLHGIGGIGVAGRPAMLGGGAMAVQPMNEAAVRVVVPTVQGPLAPDVVERTVHASIGIVRNCYLSQLRQNPLLAGRITISATIAADGHVTAADVADDSVGNGVLTTCVVGVVRRLVFVLPPGNGAITHVELPYEFQNDD